MPDKFVQDTEKFLKWTAIIGSLLMAAITSLTALDLFIAPVFKVSMSLQYKSFVLIMSLINFYCFVFFLYNKRLPFMSHRK